MIGWLIDALVISSASGAAAQPRTAEEAGERFFFRALAVALGLVLALAGSLVAWSAGGDAFRDVGVAMAVVGALLVVTGIPRLVHLWRAASALRSRDASMPDRPGRQAP